MKVHVLHENPDWYAPLDAALGAAGVPHQQWLLGDGLLDLDDEPPDGVFWSRASASSLPANLPRRAISLGPHFYEYPPARCLRTQSAAPV